LNVAQSSPVAPVAAAPPLGRSAAFGPVGRTEVRETPLTLAAPLGRRASNPFRLDGDGRFRFALQPNRPPWRVQHIEQSLVDSYSARVDGAG
jgi:hypothetical protein